MAQAKVKAEEAAADAAPVPDPVVDTPIADLDDMDAVDERRTQALADLSTLFGSPCFPMMLPESLDNDVVDNIYEELRKAHAPGGECLLVVVDSGGGDIHSAYNLALLFRRYGKYLHFIVPRWAKSAATLLVCGGNEISMTPVSELGPVDPQITAFNPLENRLEQFSPLHIESTLELIRSEFASGNSKLADGLLQRLQFPLTLGSFKVSLDVGKVYIQHLLSTRMMADSDPDAIVTIANKFVEGYSDHGYVIGTDELQALGLNVNELEGDKLDIVWTLHLLNRKKQELKRLKEQEEMDERIRQLPPDLLFSPAGPANNGGGS